VRPALPRPALDRVGHHHRRVDRHHLVRTHRRTAAHRMDDVAMTEHLCACSRPSPDAVLCAHCGHLLRKTLGEVSEYHGLGWDLDLALSRQVRIERPTGKADPDPELRLPGTLRPTPSPYD